jgi:chorismate mutase
MQTATERIDRTIAELEAERTRIGEAISSLKAAQARLAPAVTVNGNGKPHGNGNGNGNGHADAVELTQTDKIERFLRSAARPMTASEIADGTGVPFNSLWVAMGGRNSKRFLAFGVRGSRTYTVKNK